MTRRGQNSAAAPAGRQAPLERVVSRAREIGEGVAARHAAAVDADARWPHEAMEALAEGGLNGLTVPRAHGGLGHGLLALAETGEELGRHCTSTALCFGMHCVGASVIAARPTPGQVDRYLEPIAAGRHLTTLALSEPGSGAHFYLPETSLEAVPPDGYRVSGTKTFVTNGGHADSYVISTVTPDSALPGRFSCLVLPGDAGNLTWGPPWAGFGMRGNSSRSLSIDGARVTTDDLLGNEGDQIWYVFTVVAPYFLIAMAGAYLGAAVGALDEAALHLKARTYSTSGRRLAQEPILQHRFGTLWAAVERTRRLVRHAAAAGDAGDPGALPVILSAKAEVADCAVSVANEAMTLLGGIGYRESAKAQRHLRDARAAHVMSPTTDLLRTWAGRALLDQPLLSE